MTGIRSAGYAAPAVLRTLASIGAAILLSVAPAAPVGAQAPRLNLTGAWDGAFWGGTDIRITQDGDRAWGTFESGNYPGFVRGSWIGGRAILIFTPTSATVGQACEARKLLVVSAKGVLTKIEPYVIDLAGGAPYTGNMTRKSPTPGSVADYPFEAELANCGQLLTYDLVFDTNSDKLTGTEFQILDVLAGLLKKDPKLKIQVAGHTDASGNAKANQDLSERRANAVRQMLVDRYGIAADRLTARGFGPDQPIADNGTEEGRAINRRVELIRQ